MKKQFTARDLWRFSYLSWPQVSEDGRFAAVVVKTPGPDGVCRPGVRLLSADTGEVLYETPAGRRETQPRFLPDGSLALLSDESGEYQVWIVKDGKREKKTSLRHGVSHYDAVNGVIAFEAMLWPEEIAAGTAFSEMTPEEKAAWEADLALRPYVAEDLTYKMDEWFGMRKGERPVVGLREEKGAFLLLPEGTESVYPALSPDGSAAAFFAYPDGGIKGRDPQLMLWRAGASAVRLSKDEMLCASQAPVFSPDGKSVYALAYEKFEDGYSQVLARFDLSETEKPAYFPGLTEETVCGGVNEAVISRTENGENRSCFYLAENKALFLSCWRGKSKLFSMALEDGKAVEALALDYMDITGFAANRRGDLAVLAGSDKAPADLYLNGKRLTNEHEWLREYELPETEEFHVGSRDGKADLQYFLTYPMGYRKGAPCPAVLDIKGGPETMYGPAYWHEFHALSAAGFAVIHGNPRGSAGFGRGFRADGVCWKDEAMHDLMDMCRDAVDKGIVDPGRIGVTGGSYGGYMTVKLISKTDIFSAAAGQRVFVNPGTSYGTGDVGWVSAGEIPPHFSMLKYLEDRARGSNASRVDQIHVPLLLLHGYRDYRCTFEQAEQLFIPLRERHPQLPLRLVMFPKENHALTRTGNMKAQERHLQEITDWFVRYLREKEEAPDETPRDH